MASGLRQQSAQGSTPRGGSPGCPLPEPRHLLPQGACTQVLPRCPRGLPLCRVAGRQAGGASCPHRSGPPRGAVPAPPPPRPLSQGRRRTGGRPAPPALPPVSLSGCQPCPAQTVRRPDSKQRRQRCGSAAIATSSSWKIKVARISPPPTPGRTETEIGPQARLLRDLRLREHGKGQRCAEGREAGRGPVTGWGGGQTPGLGPEGSPAQGVRKPTLLAHSCPRSQLQARPPGEAELCPLPHPHAQARHPKQTH